MARPQVEIDESVVEKLASIQCTMIEIAAVVGCSVDTLERRFADTIKTGRAKGRSSLRRLQWEAAQKGSNAMLIWLGKQLLGQSDKLVTMDKTPEVESSIAERQARIDLIKKMAREIS